MHSSTQSRLAVPLVVVVALAGLYFASTGVAEARTNSLGLDKSATSTASSTKPRAQVDATCMSAAVEVRETALQTAWTALNTTLTTALTERKTDMVAAWTLTDVAARSKALKTAWADWKVTKKSAHTTFRSDRKAAWDDFKKTAKDECKLKLPKDEAQEKATSDSVAI
jgi:hypothetical protein